MKKKQLTLTSAMATTLLALPACSSNSNDWDDATVYAARDTAVCVDQNGERIPDYHCNNSSRSHYYGGSGVRWFYVGQSSPLPYYGDSVNDPRYAQRGSYAPTAGVSYDRAPASANIARSSAASRGGLGSSARSYGGGRS